MSELTPYRAAFLEKCLSANALSFGSWTLKSGRTSPYFFNAGLFHRADLLRSISTVFAQTLADHSPAIDFDVIFGPAYKGIPLAAATVDKLAQIDEARYGGVSYSFNRKEAKDHGEGGILVGSGLKGKRVVIVDDVITAGTAIREAISIIKQQGGELVGIVVAMDRQEKTPMLGADGKAVYGNEDDGKPRPSAIGQVRKEYGIPVIACVTLDDVVEFVRKDGVGTKQNLEDMEKYRTKFKASD
jgi:orotate phosphoribosyltransferase